MYDSSANEWTTTYRSSELIFGHKADVAHDYVDGQLCNLNDERHPFPIVPFYKSKCAPYKDYLYILHTGSSYRANGYPTSFIGEYRWEAHWVEVKTIPCPIGRLYYQWVFLACNGFLMLLNP